MSETIENWYRERFNQRIEKNQLLKLGCSHWAELETTQKEIIKSYVEDVKALHFGYFHSNDLWTFIGVEHIYSYYENKLVKV